MNRRATVLVAVAASAIAVFGLFTHIQKPESARVLRRGERVTTLAKPVAFAPRLGSSCITRLRDGNLVYEGNVAIGDLGALLEVDIEYRPPARILTPWPVGHWCDSLTRRVAELSAGWSRTQSSDAIVAKPREAGWSATEYFERELERSGLRIARLSARIALPPGARATLPVDDVAKLAVEERPVFFVGLDGADWQLLDHYIAAGKMPNLASLVKEGARGVLETEHPPLSPLLWNTMMTGLSPLDHGILDFTRFNPLSGNREPITADERRAPAVWNMATYAGRKVGVVGLWATYPAEPVRGVLVSDRLFTFLHQEETPPPGVVFPPPRESWARAALARIERHLGYADVKKFLPWLTEAEYQQHAKTANPYGHPISALRRILVETALYDHLATSYWTDAQPDLMIAYLQGTDSVGHMFAPYTPPRQPHISLEEFERYRRVPEAYFEYVDRILGSYRNLAQKRNAVLVIGSDHGFHWFEDRPKELSSFAATTAAKWHRKEGVYLIWGAPEVRSGGRGTIRQIAPTLLALSGLPRSSSIDVEPLAGVRFASTHSVDYAKHFTPVAPLNTASGKAAEEEVAKLRALGYLGASESASASPASRGSTRTAGSYNNEGLILRDAKREADAVRAFERAIEIDPNLASALWNLSDILATKNQIDRADELLVRAVANGLPEGRKFLIGRAIYYQRNGKLQRSVRLLDATVQAIPNDPEYRMFRGRYRIESRDCRGALDDFRAAQQLAPTNPVTYSSAGLAAVCLGDTAEAQRNFRRSLELDPNQPRLREFLR